MMERISPVMWALLATGTSSTSSNYASFPQLELNDNFNGPWLGFKEMLVVVTQMHLEKKEEKGKCCDTRLIIKKM